MTQLFQNKVLILHINYNNLDYGNKNELGATNL